MIPGPLIDERTFYSWPLSLRYGYFKVTDKFFYAKEGTWFYKTEFTCKYDSIFDVKIDNTKDSNFILLGIVVLLLYILLFTIPLGIALIHRGLQNKVMISLKNGKTKNIYASSEVLTVIKYRIEELMKYNPTREVIDQLLESYDTNEQKNLKNSKI